jgi:hypothetical protein
MSKEQQSAIANGEPVDPDHNTGPLTVEEMNLLAGEADELISRRESHDH